MATATYERFEGSVVQVGNSRGMRLPAGFFRNHPEFTGKVQLTVVGEGQALLSAKPAPRDAARDGQTTEASDPFLAPFLQFLEQQMALHPEDIVPADATQLARIAALVEGVEIDA